MMSTSVSPQTARMADYDAIVIGAGHNGLASAIHLVSKG